MKKKIILATTSPRRIQLAKQMGLEFQAIPSNYEENMNQKLAPKELAKELAYGKAKEVAGRVKEGIVLGIDTFIVFEGKIQGKAKNVEEARKMLTSYSGKKQQVYSGIVIIDAQTGKTIKDYEVTTVKFRKIKPTEIENYLKTTEWTDKAGAYAIQGLSAIFIEKINGDYHNVMGFPIHKIHKLLEKIRVNIFEYEEWKK